jgi:hypothetical protein
VNALVVSNYTPEAASDFPIIAVYFMFNTLLVSVSVGASVVVLNFHFRGHRKTKVPGWLKRLFFIKPDNKNLESLNQDLLLMKRDSSIYDNNEFSSSISDQSHENFSTDSRYVPNHVFECRRQWERERATRNDSQLSGRPIAIIKEKPVNSIINQLFHFDLIHF